MKLSTGCILQVEDDEHDVFFLQYAFKQAGITNPVQVAKDGEQAVEYLAGIGQFADRMKYPLPVLVLLDLKLPRRSGMEVLQWMREQPGLRTTVVIVLTSSSDPADVERGYQLGANSFVPKPVDTAERAEFAKFLKGWWLGWNQYAPTAETRACVSALAGSPRLAKDPLASETAMRSYLATKVT